ncbi:histidine kinase [Rivibacter subsaxonicus]|uniref:histidine kinase n=1 Tax=Rivibacter subsaxonicus TaxID=457575 RepID=A0A4Q7W1L7_9BURK|nr:histidine kinase [Rivibacter subsaxonicus]
MLIIHSFGRDFAPYNIVATTLRTDLTQLMRESVALYESSLDLELGSSPENERLFLDYLVRRNHGAPPDLVIAIANPAMLFCLRYRDQLFPGRPLLVTGLDRRRLETVKLPPGDRAVTVTLDFPAVARTILKLRPETDTLALVYGRSQIEQFWGKAIERELAPFADRLRVLPAGDLNLEQMRQRVAALPPRSAVFYYMFAVSNDGALHEDERALPAIRESSNAPVYGIFSDQLGRGIVGGPLVDSRNMGVVTAKLAASMLKGELTGDKVEVPMPVPAPSFDWRELRRWDIPESRLPPGAEVRFRPPSVWEENRQLILAGAAVVLLQAVLIAALLFQRSRRRHAEKEAIGMSGRLLTAHEDERRRLARELHDDLTQRLARLAVDAGRLERTAGADAAAMRVDLAHLSEDVHAMSYRLHPSVLDDLGLVEALRAECDRVAQSGDLQVDVEAHGVPRSVPAEASLCLFRVAQEAMSNATRHGQASAVTVLLSSRDRGLQLAVADNGSGFDPAQSRERASLGLASMRERVRLLHGVLDIESTPGRGTTVIAWVPTST